MRIKSMLNRRQFYQMKQWKSPHYQHTVCQTSRMLLFLCFLPVAMGQQGDLRFSKVLDTQGSVLLQWEFNNNTNNMTFKLQTKTTGWIGFGLSPSGGMMGADIVIGGVYPNKTTYFADYHGIGFQAPVLDVIQNYNLLSLIENGTHTTMMFSRKLRTCDPFDMDITTDTMHVISAYGLNDKIQYHGQNRFQKSILLLNNMTPLRTPATSFTYDMVMSNFPVPEAATTYGCAYLPLPTVSQKHHIYKFEAYINPGHEDLVHHVLIFSCPNSTDVSVKPRICEAGNTDYNRCSQVIVGWAIGGGPFTLPDNVGISLGTPLDPLYVMIEVHYNNLRRQSGLLDNSGIRLYYTSELRTHDAGVLTVASRVSRVIFIPPMAESYKVYAVCKTDLFNQVNGEEVPEMQGIGSMLHSHVAGRAIQVAHYRNGVQIGFLDRDMNYDFNYQDFRHFPSTIPIKMGDEIVVECIYNTEDRTSVTWGGWSTMEEMCNAYILYYPRNFIAGCFSYPNNSQVAAALGLDPEKYPDILESLPWSPEDIKKAQDITKEASQIISVINFNGSLLLDSGLLHDIIAPAEAPCESSV